MKVAVISDIHGNWRALEAVLDDIRTRNVDRIVCGGDVVNPFLRSKDVYLRLKELGIPIVRGNHEDYIASYHTPGDRPEIKESARFLPVRLVAQHLGPEIARELAALPFELVIPGPGGDDLYVCHASPLQNARSYIIGVEGPMAEAVGRVRQRTLVAGHIHSQWMSTWQEHKLVIAGSVGLPLTGQPRPGYVIMSHENGSWEAYHRTVAYDNLAATREYVESGLVERGGPFAWMLVDELLTARARLAHFIPRMMKTGGVPDTIEKLAPPVRQFLEEQGRWDALQPYLNSV